MALLTRHGLVLALLLSLGICGTGDDSDGESGLFIESDICGPNLVLCAEASPCFDHNTGECLEDGNITQADCEEAFAFCQSCFPNSRCGSTEGLPVDKSSVIIESNICLPCAVASLCFDHNLGICQEDGSITTEGCQAAIPWCKPCFPNSRCGSIEGLRVRYVRRIMPIVLSIFSASLSTIGSSTILFKILQDRAHNGIITPYDRIILGLSSCDILASIMIATDDFLVPSETSSHVWASGNLATCQAEGFLKQLSIPWAIWYNGILSFYFLVTVLSQVKRKDYVRKCEPWMHLSGIFFPITAIMGLCLGWYSERGLFELCGITDPIIRRIVAEIPVVITHLFLIINYSTIYVIVRTSLQSSNESSEHDNVPMTVKKRIMREATNIMLLYVLCFWFTTIPISVLAILTNQGYTGKFLYPLVILQAITWPLQGFCNVCIYLKPAYTRFLAANPNKPMRFVLHQALFNPEVPQLHYPSAPSTSNAFAVESVGRVGISDIVFESHLNFDEDVEENENDIGVNEDAKEE